MKQEFDKEFALIEIIRLKQAVRRWQDVTFVLACVIAGLAAAVITIAIL